MKSKYTPPPFNVTAYQQVAHAQTIDKPHIKSAKKGGQVPGIPLRNRKFPNGKKAAKA